MAVTLQDIADRVGVKKSTVSVVLNNRTTAIKVSDKTRRRIYQAVKELDYHPNAAARALTTNRTGQIGFILSDSVAEAWGNAYYAQCLQGVEKTCHDRGYGLNITTYNLSNFETFVFPSRVGERTVDGLILADYAHGAVLKTFREFRIPFICIGDDRELPEEAPSVVSDCSTQMGLAFEYLAELGHRRIALHIADRWRAKQWAEDILTRLRRRVKLAECELTTLITPKQTADYSDAPDMLNVWRNIEPARRPTAVMGGYQVILGLLREMHRAGLRCPEDLSVISGFDLPFCEAAVPALTSVRQDAQTLGAKAAELLIDHVEGKSRLLNQNYTCELNPELLIRESCTSPDSPDN
ncbi:MAG: LacI family DNA-binding transcriptional regulator [Phycisphaerae bacterium]|nr:LacI family DNA-binding transcriptional regulator [Phycisphaerae bacterium]